VECDEVEFNPGGENTNLWTFRDDDWPPELGEGREQLAHTTLTFDAETGELLDADVEINTENFPITLDSPNGDFDLQTLISHEMGHFLGLGDTSLAGAMMESPVVPGERRNKLSPDDVTGICEIYSDQLSRDSCEPLGGFSPLCARDQVLEASSEPASNPGTSGCSLVSKGPQSPHLSWLIWTAVLFLGRLRRRET
jgi:hypothetical protein